ncbi:aa3-type cytochrome c oxidase subunit IV [Chelatococcus sp. GCM10030263]|uniref:aa3-type cytochrome c oxidase subunit IV n=1 Tax=Chelatococcus sp. GCM10030263 TaxID=3273387 RepID=UPI0036063EE7
MANNAPATTEHGSPAMDYAEHERTYRGFLTFAKWGSIHIVVILILMAFFLL